MPTTQLPGIIGWGAGGHAKSVIEAVLSTDRWTVVGLIDSDRSRWGAIWAGQPILGGAEGLPDLLSKGVRDAFVAVGGVGDNRPRIRVFEQLSNAGFRLPPIVHRSTIVAHSAQVGRGTVLLAGVIVGADATIGDNVILNTGAIVEHDCQIGSHCHISTGSRLGGGVRVGEAAHVGIGATIRDGLTIGPFAIVGAGSVVINDVARNATVAGVPARVIKDASAQ